MTCCRDQSCIVADTVSCGRPRAAQYTSQTAIAVITEMKASARKILISTLQKERGTEVPLISLPSSDHAYDLSLLGNILPVSSRVVKFLQCSHDEEVRQ